MGWDSIFGLGERIMDKFVPGREERIRNKIDKLKGERDDLTKPGAAYTTRAAVKYDKLSDQIERLKGKLQNR